MPCRMAVRKHSPPATLKPLFAGISTYQEREHVHTLCPNAR